MKMDLGDWQVAGNATPDSTLLAIEARGIVKHFDGFTAVDGIDLTVPEGAIYGILGPNGAGKTTTLRMLLGSVFLSNGSMATTVREVRTISMPVTMMQLMVFFLVSLCDRQPG
jgi:ABC-type multidrug transport system ATPase subunit